MVRGGGVEGGGVGGQCGVGGEVREVETQSLKEVAKGRGHGKCHRRGTGQGFPIALMGK